MAEEIIYDQIETGGDPDPLGLRKKLAASKTAKPDPLGLRAKLPAIKSTQPKESSVFKPMSDWLAVSEGYQPIVPENVVDDHSVKVKEAGQRVKGHLENIDLSIKNLIYNYKKDLTGRIKSQELAIHPGFEAAPINPQAQQLGSQLREDVPVDEQEINEFKAGMNENPVMLRQGLAQRVKDLSKTDNIQANKLKADVYRLDAQERKDKESKVSKNIEKLEEGEYDYDVVNGRLVKPEGFFESLVTGVKDKNRAFGDYEVYRSGDKNKILDLINRRLKDDPDEAVPVPEEGWLANPLAEGARMMGGQPIKPIIGAGMAGYFAGPGAAAAAGAAISAPEMYKLTFGSLLPHNYAEIKRNNPDDSDEEVLQKAIDLTNDQSNVDAASGAAMGALGAMAGFKPTGLNSGLLQKSLGSALRQIGKETVKKSLEGLGVGSVGAAGQLVKNLMAKKAGINVDESEGLAAQLIGGVGMTMGMTMIAKFPKLLKPKTYNELLQSFKNVPKEVVDENLNRLQEVGEITPEQAQSAQKAIQEQQAIDNSIQPNVPQADRLKVQSKIKQRNELEASLETTDKAYHPEIKEKIKALNEEIVNISKGGERDELQQLVDKETSGDNVEGYVKDILVNASENDLKKYFKEISDQAHDPNSEAATIATFGESIVNKAKELFPIEAPKESKISVIQPGEVKQPTEVITIKPQDHAETIRSDEGQVSSGGDELRRIPEQSSSDIQRKAQQEPILAETEQQTGIGGQAKEKGHAEGEAKIGGPPEIGITHRQMDAVAEELGFETYQKDAPESLELWDKQARERLAKDPDALNKLITKLRNGEGVDKVETRMMIMNLADKKAKYDANPTPEKLNEIKRLKDLYNISGREKGRELVARKGSVPTEETLADFHLRDVEYNQGAPLTERQVAQSTKEFHEIKAVKDAYEQKVAQLQVENAKLKAEQKIKEQSKTSKSQPKKDYTSERKQIITDIKEKLRKARGETSVVAVPYAKELIAIAPDVAKLVKSYVEQGIKELPELVKHIHGALKEELPEITEKDVHNIIAGEYNEKKLSRNQLAQQLYDIKKEAKLINELEQLQKGQIPKEAKKQKNRNQKIKKLKEQIKELRDEMGLNDKTDAEKLSALKARYTKQIKELETKISKGDYGPDEKPEPLKLDKEAQELKDKFIQLKKEREIRLAKEEFENRSKAQKVKDELISALNTPREVMASVDFSAPLRQGLVATVSHPTVAAKAFPEMFRQAFSETKFDRWLNELKESPEYPVMEKSKLYVADPNSLNLSAKEEQFMGSLVHRIPIIKRTLGKLVKGSERAYVAYLNKMRTDIFKQGMELFESQGRTIDNSPELYEGLANYINNATGRGGLGPLNKAAPILNTAFFSPRLIASRINLLNPLYYVKLPKAVRMMALEDMWHVISFGTVLLTLAKINGAEVEDDMRSSDFGKIKVGNTRWDVWGGFQQYVRLIAQEISGKTKSATSGAIRELRGDKFPYKSRLDQLANFFRGKLAPVPGTAVDLLAGRNVVGDEFEVSTKAYELFVPMIAQDIKDAWKDHGFAALFTVGAPSSFGVGVSTFEPKKKSSNTDSGKSRQTRTINRERQHR